MPTIPQWIKIKGALIPTNCQTSISKITPTSNNRVAIHYQDGGKDEFPYANASLQQGVMTSLEISLQAKTLDAPQIQSISVASIASASLPKDAFISGINFDSTAAIIARSDYNSFGDTPMTVVFINSTTLKVTIPALSADTYDIIYSDSNGATATLQFGLIVS